MEGHWQGDEIVVNGDARQQFHNARGFGRPRSGGSIGLAPVEAAYLLGSGDLDSVDGEGFGSFVSTLADTTLGGIARFHTYADLRRRGYYLSPTRPGWGGATDDTSDFVVYSRGSGPGDGDVAFRVRVVSEHTSISAAELGGVVVSIVDDESEVTYLETTDYTVGGSWSHSSLDVTGTFGGDRVIVSDPPAALYDNGFFGQPIGEGDTPSLLQLSVIEATYLEQIGVLSIDLPSDISLGEIGSEQAGFDQRLRVYSALRSAGVVPKTGLKFGADFRTYTDFSTVDEIGHSEHLVHVLPPTHTFTPRGLALCVRLANGVRKRTLFALTDGTNGVTWLLVSRLTP